VLLEDLDMPQPTSRGSDKVCGTTRKGRKRVAVSNPGKSGIRAAAAIAPRPRRQVASACKLASRRLREVLRSLRACARAIQSLYSSSWAWNPASGELFWSREQFRIFGLDPENNKVSYQILFRMVHADERAQVEREFKEAVRARVQMQQVLGLDERVLERVFEPFYTTKPRGTGIGLAISRTVIEAHGGQIWAVPNEASGTTCQFRLPFGRTRAE
jgi:hypothetical protein